jgi:eukaryotic-like serine/threonine-protein kinase
MVGRGASLTRRIIACRATSLTAIEDGRSTPSGIPTAYVWARSLRNPRVVTDPSTLGGYRLIAELGRGGMADVYLTAVEGPTGTGFTKLAVVKKLRAHLAEDPELVAMFMDEARLTAKLTHPNVVQLFEVGHVDEQYFIAMEHLEGQPFHRVERRIEKAAMRAGTKVAREIYYAIISDVLAGLHYAHELADYDGTPLAVVHRDVTPHNVFVTYDGAVKVVDFGLAKATGRAIETEVGIVKGKVRYMSPEQASGGTVDRRTDIFAVGVILWSAATGAKLWADRDDASIASALEAGDYPASPREVCPDVPEAIDAICRKALAAKREDRYATAAAMRADLEAFLGLESATVRAKLTTLMKELFENERAKLRAVLENAKLTSLRTLDASKAVARRRSARPARAAATRGRPADAAEREPSVAPMALAPAAARRSWRRFAGTITLAAAALVVALAVAVFARAVPAAPAAANGGGAVANRGPAAVASELTSPSAHIRAKDDHAEELPLKKRALRRVGSMAQSDVSDEPESAAPATPATPSAAEAPNTRARPGVPIDQSDPWAPARP